jgi:hypothetical protein
MSSTHIGTTYADSIGFRRFYRTVLLIQGIHVFEHLMQLIQVYLLKVPSEEALGILGAFFAVGKSAEVLHFAFNAAFLLSLYLLLPGVIGLYGLNRIPRRALLQFAIFGTGVESWHIVEHVVIMKHFLHHHACPCAGILDSALGVTDIQLHFVYNAIAFFGAVTPAWYLRFRPQTVSETASETARHAAPRTAANA